MSEDLGVRVLMDNGHTAARAGQIIFPPAMLREHLVRAGICEPVLPEKPAKGVILKR